MYEAFSDDEHVCVHDGAVTHQMYSPELRAQRILLHGLLAHRTHGLFRVSIFAIPHIAGALEELSTWLRWVRRA